MNMRYEQSGYIPGQSITGISQKTIEEYQSEIEKCKKRGTNTAALEQLLEKILAIYKEIEIQKERNKHRQESYIQLK